MSELVTVRSRNQPELRSLITENRPLRFMQAHDGMSGMIADSASVEVNGALVQFDGIWLSSFADSTIRGLPDASLVSLESRLASARELLRVSHKPVLMDGENGGAPGEVRSLVSVLESLGIAGVVLEDKVEPKRNSLSAANHYLDTPERFAAKLAEACSSRKAASFVIVARIESLIAGAGLDDALRRAEAYVSAGVDGVLIHSRESVPENLFAFAAAFERMGSGQPDHPFLACVPTTYNQVTDAELFEQGFKVIIHGNQLVRAAYSAMAVAAKAVLENDRSLEADSLTASVEDISQRMGMDSVLAADQAQGRADSP